MSFLKNLFNKPTPELHTLDLNKKLDMAFFIFNQFTPLVTDGIDDIKKLNHSKELIKNSILFIYRELKREPGKSYILGKYLRIKSTDQYDQYLDLLSQMLIALSDFHNKGDSDSTHYSSTIEKLNPSNQDFLKNMDAFISKQNESMRETEFYLSEISSINVDLKNGTNNKKIQYYDVV